MKKLYGFHYDYEGRLRKLGCISYIDVIQGPLGTFSAQKVIIDGKLYSPRKAFFPETMDHQAVIDNIWDAIGNGKVDLLDNGDLQITGAGRSGITIECYVTPQGKVTTAYPVVV